MSFRGICSVFPEIGLANIESLKPTLFKSVFYEVASLLKQLSALCFSRTALAGIKLALIAKKLKKLKINDH